MAPPAALPAALPRLVRPSPVDPPLLELPVSLVVGRLPLEPELVLELLLFSAAARCLARCWALRCLAAL